jgi:Carbohydrate esterase, sialic acid-specific acetylesterase
MKRDVLQSLAVATVLAVSNAGCESGTNAASPPAATGQESPPPADVPSAGADMPENGAGEPGVTPTPAEPAAGDGTGVEGTSAEVSPVVNGGITPSAEGSGSEAVDPVDGSGEVGPGDIAGAPTFHVFLLLGQSNMAGYPKAQPADRAEDPRVRVLGFDNCAATGRVTDQWDVAAPPLHECWNDGLGPGDYFAKTLLDIIPEGDSIGLVPCAISGERIEPFLKVGGTRYDYIVRRARMAQEAGGVIEGILFHQGESNSGDASWPGKVNTLVTDLRTDLALGDVPFLAGELLYTGGTAGHNTQVNRIPGMVSNSFVISANGLVVDPADTQWNLHFGHDSVVEFGKRYAQTMIEALGW